MNEYTEACQWLIDCPHPLCENVRLKDDGALYHHFVDDHEFSRTRPTRNGSKKGSKRKFSTENGGLQWIPLEPERALSEASPPRRPRKKVRFEIPTISPQLPSSFDDDDDDNTTPAVAAHEQPIQLDPSSPPHVPCVTWSCWTSTTWDRIST